MLRTRVAAASAAAASILLATPAVAHAGNPHPVPGPTITKTVIATGLDNPRGLSMGNGGTLYVAEAGLGAGSATAGVQAGLGQTGAITAVSRAGSANPGQSRIVSGLWSAASDEGSGLEAIGLDGISAYDHGARGGVVGIYGTGGVPGTDLGNAVAYPARGASKTLAAVGAADLAWTGAHASDPWAPAGQFPDANPYGVLVAGRHTYVVDAGSNTLDEVMSDGTVQILAYFPNTPISDSVPTCVAQGPDGALYVGTLALADFFAHGPGTATVYRVDPSATNAADLNTVLNVATVWATGFSTITGCTFSPAGDFYATEMFTGDVVKVPFAHPATGRTTIGAGQLTLPNGVAVDKNGAIYVSNKSDSTTAGAGEIVRFRTGGKH